MTTNVPVLPVAASTLVRASLALISLITHWLRSLARARRHRREAHALAGLDRRMLADIGITRADLRDAFSEPFWDDPTALLRERALERRLSRAVTGAKRRPTVASPFRQPETGRPARYTV